jgi:hypothetical protein
MTGTELSCAGTAPQCGSTAATLMIGRLDWRLSRRLPRGSRPKVSRLTARRLCSGLTACHGSRSYSGGRPLAPRSSMPSTLSSIMATTCAICRSSIARQLWRVCCAILRLASCSMNTSSRTAGRLRLRLPAWRRGHRVEEDRWHVSIRPVPRLDQGPQSCQHRRRGSLGVGLSGVT